MGTYPFPSEINPYSLAATSLRLNGRVREITIEDRYEITLNATFEIDVPAVVVVLSSHSINLPKMAADEVFLWRTYPDQSWINQDRTHSADFTQR